MSKPELERRRFIGMGGVAMATLAGCASPGERRGVATAIPPAVAVEASSSPFLLPGPHFGRVADVYHSGAMVNRKPQAGPVSEMLSRGIMSLTGAPDSISAWRSLFAPGQRVGIKVNPVGMASKNKKDAVSAITSPEAIAAVVAGLESAGIGRKDVLLFERYRNEFVACGYPDKAASLGIPWDCSAISYDNTQIDIEGYSKDDPDGEAKGLKARADGIKVSGYDPEVFVELDFVHPLNNPNDPRSRRSHLSNIVSKKVDRIVNLVVMKDHMVAGVTGALKNISHGYVNNVSRTHSRPSLNQANTFIPAIVSMPQIRSKVALNVMEALIGIYHNGPWGSPNVWEPNRLLVATDPVAMDWVAWKSIDQRRVEAGLPLLGRAGTQADDPEVEGHGREMFGRRSVEHVELCGVRGLGVFPDDLETWHRHFGEPTADRPTFLHSELRIG